MEITASQDQAQMNKLMNLKNRLSGSIDKDEKLKDACADFEAILVQKLFETMRQTLPGVDIFGDSMGKKVWESMYYDELSKKVAHGKGLGLKDMLYNDLKTQLEKNQHQIKRSASPEEHTSSVVGKPVNMVS